MNLEPIFPQSNQTNEGNTTTLSIGNNLWWREKKTIWLNFYICFFVCLFVCWPFLFSFLNSLFVRVVDPIDLSYLKVRMKIIAIGKDHCVFDYVENVTFLLFCFVSNKNCSWHISRHIHFYIFIYLLHVIIVHKFLFNINPSPKLWFCFVAAILFFHCVS